MRRRPCRACGRACRCCSPIPPACAIGCCPSWAKHSPKRARGARFGPCSPTSRLKARLPLAAASLAEADGDTEAALAGYDALVRGRDRKARSVALRRAVELRLRTGLIDAAAAARAYAASPVAWRGDAAERDARIRLAQLLAQSEDAAGALALLRQTAALFPDHAAAARREAGRILRGALDTGSPLAAVAAFQAGVRPPAARGPRRGGSAAGGAAAGARPARARLGAARRGGRARGRGPGAEARAEIGARLAALRLAENDPAGAQSALDATDAPELPEALRARRTTLAAAIAERRGGPAAARPERVPRRRARPGRKRRWGGATGPRRRRPWAGTSTRGCPAAPAPLGREQQEAVLRLAAALVLAGDDAALAALRERVADRMRDGPARRSLRAPGRGAAARRPRSGRRALTSAARSARPRYADSAPCFLAQGRVHAPFAVLEPGEFRAERRLAAAARHVEHVGRPGQAGDAAAQLAQQGAPFGDGHREARGAGRGVELVQVVGLHPRRAAWRGTALPAPPRCRSRRAAARSGRAGPRRRRGAGARAPPAPRPRTRARGWRARRGTARGPCRARAAGPASPAPGRPPARGCGGG